MKNIGIFLIGLILTLLITATGYAGEQADDMFRRPLAKAWYEDHNKVSLELGLGWNPELDYSKGAWLKLSTTFDDLEFDSSRLTLDWTFQGNIDQGPGQWFIRPILGIDFAYNSFSNVHRRTETNTETITTSVDHWKWVCGYWDKIWKYNCGSKLRGKRYGWWKKWHPGHWEKFTKTESKTITTTTEIITITRGRELETALNPALQIGFFQYEDSLNYHGAAWLEAGFRNQVEWYLSFNTIMGLFKWAELDFSVEGIWANQQDAVVVGRVGATFTKDIDNVSLFTRVGGIFVNKYKEFEWKVGAQIFLK